MAEHILRFGDYTFPGEFNVRGDSAGARMGTAAIPERHGILTSDPRRAERIIQVEGLLLARSGDDLRAVYDAFLAAVHGGRDKLWLYDDRYLWAQAQNVSSDYQPGQFPRMCNVALDFLCGDPFFYAADETSDAWAVPGSGTTHNVMVGGNVECWPIFEITLATTGTLDIRLALGASLYFDLEGAITDGDVLVVDSAEQTVILQADGSDKMSFFNGQFFPFAVGANILTYTKNSGDPTVAEILTRWRNRWH